MTIFFQGNFALKAENFKDKLQQWRVEHPKDEAGKHIDECLQLIHRDNFLYTMDENYYCGNHIDGLPSQCGTLVAYEWETPFWRDGWREIADEHMKKLFRLATLFGYSTILVTMPVRTHWGTYFTDHGFVSLTEFHNKRSGNKNFIYLKTL